MNQAESMVTQIASFVAKRFNVLTNHLVIVYQVNGNVMKIKEVFHLTKEQVWKGFPELGCLFFCLRCVLNLLILFNTEY